MAWQVWLAFFGAAIAIAVVGLRRPWVLIGLLVLPLMITQIRRVLRGARGPELISVLGATGRIEFLYAVLAAAGFLITGIAA